MILALSGRMFETREGISKTVEEFIQFAREAGFGGVELRLGHINPGTKDEEAYRIRDLLEGYGVRCAFVNGGNPDSPENLSNFKRMVDLAGIIGAHMVRCGGAGHENIGRFREAASYAQEKGIKVISQLHNGTLFANIDMALDTLSKIDHPNYGVAFEANHLIFDGQAEHGYGAVKRLWEARKLFSVSVQNYKPWEPGETEDRVSINGRDWVACLPGDPKGVNFPSVFQGLKEAGFDGFVTCMPGAIRAMSPEEQACYYYSYFAGLISALLL